ncbi:MAG: DNA integrity scanning protein DisA nucleotide-binding domain protein [Clostridia bacterium]|nr:DNA integrity scanning protein DisA nucleotide-binding domain protein [Clostridia bacterium]MBR2160595.1 DNA integrity scanning protein DisA nucleotide-binding domain protein [Clostridia bacterium]MBR2323751.1 DNA integrity scanning protein DisA nucleotide-binding domain protein [Clostridia bacterium]MBR2874725.1 DNA integrity scanning protein DisA nucleotide-binding domain protein [Clostridia bacterium]
MIEEISIRASEVVANFNVLTIVDLVILFAMYLVLFSIAKKYNARALIAICIGVLLLAAICTFVHLPVVSIVVRTIVALIPVMFLILFRTEFKREIWKLSRDERFMESAVATFSGTEHEVRDCIGHIVKACQSMSKRNVGALIVIVATQVPTQIAETGVYVNADVSSALIENIFTPNTPLHDGAMLISGNKVVAAGCFLPLTQDENVSKEFGTRHRAGIGITEVIDVLSIVVSEETGVITLVRRGEIERYADATVMTKALEEIYGIRSLNL